MTFYTWARQQMIKKELCKIEPSMVCIPLKEDPICQACYEGEKDKTRKEIHNT